MIFNYSIIFKTLGVLNTVRKTFDFFFFFLWGQVLTVVLAVLQLPRPGWPQTQRVHLSLDLLSTGIKGIATMPGDF